MLLPHRKPLVIVCGMIAANPFQGGATWAVLQYILGLQRLGYEVLFIEPVQSSALSPAGTSLAESENARYFRQVVSEFDFEQHSALLLAGTRETVGLEYDALLSATRRAQLLINISGLLTDEALLSSIPVRAYLDLDPAFNQLWSVQGINMRFERHTHFVTIGLSLGDLDCPVPTCNLSWIKTLQPIVLAFWPAVLSPGAHLTTIGNFRAYGSVEHNGVFYGQKAHSLRQFYPLPTRTRTKFVLAMDIHPNEVNDLRALHANGWQIEDPMKVAGSPAKYREFIQNSEAEFGIAKSGYALSQCGWFSDRSACYLASGRPVIAQDTGFSRFLPVGQGLFAFRTIEEVLAALDQLHRQPSTHGKAARAISEEYFDSDKILSRLLAQLL